MEFVLTAGQPPTTRCASVTDSPAFTVSVSSLTAGNERTSSDHSPRATGSWTTGMSSGGSDGWRPKWRWRATGSYSRGERASGPASRRVSRASWSEPAKRGPSLLHGDLWSGNTFAGPSGEPVLIDPAVYRGHREVDLAMTELFGGFPDRFYSAYEDRWPLLEGYRERRRAVYQLYPLLVHVNLFGGAYVDSTTQALERALGAA